MTCNNRERTGKSYLDGRLTIHVGDCLDRLRDLPDESVDCCITSPPYFGLRDYGTASWEGGDPECDHRTARSGAGRADGVVDDRAQRSRDGVGSLGGDCARCGARRVDSQIGLEATPQAFVAKLVDVFREVRRVLKPEGTCWVNLGDSYAGTGATCGGDDGARRGADGYGGKSPTGKGTWRSPRGTGLKVKDLIGIPWRVALALQDDGWYLRQDIIWSKPNPMPESVRDRCTKAHEYVFMLTKSPRYYFDQEAIKEPAGWPDGPNSPSSIASPYGQGFTRKARKRADRFGGNKHNGSTIKHSDGSIFTGSETRNKRSVWTVSTIPYSEAHFATFPPALVEPMVLAGCPKGGVVLDPFGGAGTTGLVALRHGRDAILIELNPDYADMAARRITTEWRTPVRPQGDVDLGPLFADLGEAAE